MDKASRALGAGVPAGVPWSFRAPADHCDVLRSTLHYRSHGRPPIESKAQRQQYLTPAEEQALVEFVLQMEALGHPEHMSYSKLLQIEAVCRALPCIICPTDAWKEDITTVKERAHVEFERMSSSEQEQVANKS